MKKSLLVAIFVVYLLVVAALTVLPTHFSRRNLPHADHINLVPLGYSFKCFQQAYVTYHDLTAFCLRNTLGNIALFLPFGFLFPLNFARYRSWQRVVGVALLVSLGIETIQFLLRFVGSPRAVDIDDVLLNTLGAWLGFLIWRYTGKRGKWGKG